MIGDVCGHGPAEAAVGVALRIAWRTLTMAGADETETLAVMDAVLREERDEREPFVTVCDVTLDLAAQELTMRLHGHPSPLLVMPEARWLGHGAAAPPLGLLDDMRQILAGLPLLFVGVMCPLDVIMARRNAEPQPSRYAAGFVVPPRTLVAGLPAKVMRDLRPDEIAWKTEGTEEYQRLARRSLATMVACAPLEAEEPGRGRVDAGTSQPLHKVKGG